MNSNRILIIGGGQAAASFSVRMRTHDENSTVTIVSDEPSLPYQRPPLSKKYATGEMSQDQLLLRPADWYAQASVTCKLQTKVQAIDTVGKTAVTEKGEVLSWDKLVFATGSRPRALPDQTGGNLEGVHLLRTIAEADGIAGRLKGGGYIGLEAAAVCASKGLQVTLVEAAERILQRVACKETSDWFRQCHVDHKVSIHEGIGLDRLEGKDSKVFRAVLSDGTTLEADFVLVGIGILPNSELAEQAGLEVSGGILVNANCQTLNPDIYAAGDCAVFDYRGEKTRLESVQNAIDQAECAADNIAGNTREYVPYPWFWSDQYDVKLQIAGLNRGYDTIITRPGDREGGVSHFYYKGDMFLAVDAINDPRTYMICKKMLEAGKNITPSQARDTNFQLKTLL